MITKVAKIEIRRPLHFEKDIFYKVMYNMQHQCWKLANKAITMLWDYQQFDFAYKKRFNQYFLKDQVVLPSGYKQVESDILNNLKGEIPLLHSACKDALILMVSKKWKTDKKDVLNGNKSIPSFKRTLPIELHNKQFMDSKKNVRIFNEKGTYTTIISLLPKEVAKKHGLKDGNMELELIVKGDYLKPIIDRLINGEYKLAMSKMQFNQRKKKWFLFLAYSFEIMKKELDTNKVLGVDLGINIPAMCAVSNEWRMLAVGNRSEIERFENEMRSKQHELQKSCVWASEGAIGHGVKRRIKRLEKIGTRIANFKSTKNHCYSRTIVNFALNNQCGTIQLEDLSGISEDNVFLKKWTYYDLQQKIEKKAKEHGIKIVKVNPAYTSQRCNQCGFIHKNVKQKYWRPTQETFKCINCSYVTNADVNAARNIALKDIGEIVREQLKMQEKALQNTLKYQ